MGREQRLREAAESAQAEADAAAAGRSLDSLNRDELTIRQLKEIIKLQQLLLERLMINVDSQEMNGYVEQITKMEQDFTSQAELVRNADARRQQQLDREEAKQRGTSTASGTLHIGNLD